MCGGDGNRINNDMDCRKKVVDVSATKHQDYITHKMNI